MTVDGDLRPLERLEAPRAWALAARTCFWAALALAAASSLALAAGNQHPGSLDSIHNLHTARNIAEGRGYTSDIVHQFWVDQAVPAAETVRPPGVPFVLAALFWLFGVSLVWPVLLNGLTVVGTALVVRAALRRSGERLLGDVAGTALLLGQGQEPLSLWNNNGLVLCTAVLFWIGVRVQQRSLGRVLGYVAVGAVGAFGVYLKPTFLLTAGATAAALAFFDDRWGPRRFARWRPLAIALLALVALTAPYWVRDLVLFGEPFYNPMRFVRLVARYGGGPNGFELWPTGTWWTVRYGAPYGYGELIRELGLAEVLAREAAVLLRAAADVVRLNPVATFLAAAAIPFLRRASAPGVALAAGLCGEAAFSALYISVDERYLWPAVVALFALGAVGARELRERWLDAELWHPRVATAVLLVVLPLLVSGWTDKLDARRQVSRLDPPTYGPALQELVPEGGVVLTDQPWAAMWYGRRSAVLAPVGSGDDLRVVLERYRPTHFLWTRSDTAPGPTPFRPEDVRAVAHDDVEGRRWTLFEITSGP